MATVIDLDPHVTSRPQWKMYKKNKARYTKALVTCGWAGEVMPKLLVNAGIVICYRPTDGPTDGPTEGPTEKWVKESCARG